MGEILSNQNYYEGIACAHFGEFLQGYLPSQTNFLISCPITMQCVCRIYDESMSGQKLAEKTKLFLMLFQEMEQIRINNKIIFESPIPIGVGLGSSTADLVALFHAINNLHGSKYSNDFCSKILSKIEPSDSNLYSGLLVFNHYLAEPIYFIKNIIPNFIIIGVIENRLVNTLEYNKSLHFTKYEQDKYSSLLNDFIEACESGNQELFGLISTTSIEMNFVRNYHPNFKYLKPIVTETDACGIIGAHSGSCTGILISIEDPELLTKVAFIKKYLIQKGFSPFIFQTNFGSRLVNERNF